VKKPREQGQLDPDDKAMQVTRSEYGMTKREKELIDTLRRLYKERKPRKAAKKAQSWA
jgi:hypothetical protein